MCIWGKETSQQNCGEILQKKVGVRNEITSTYFRHDQLRGFVRRVVTSQPLPVTCVIALTIMRVCHYSL